MIEKRPRFKTQGFKRQVVACDPKWWNSHSQEVFEWLDANTVRGAKYTSLSRGNLINFEHESELTAFLLVWAG